MRVLVLAITALGTACSVEHGTRFQHASHAGKGLTCKSCHPAIAARTRPGPSAVATADKCTSCHPAPHQGKDYGPSCGRCHGAKEREEAGAKHLRFDHAKHLAKTKGQCFPCHQAVQVKASRHARLTPGHAECGRCHEKELEPAAMDCQFCHERLDVFPLKPVSQFSHAGDFLRNHGRAAIGRIGLCAQCHTQPYCATCHDPRSAGVRKPSLRWPDDVDKSFIHRGDYVGRHAIEARSQGDQCVRCHARQECTGCHDQRAVGQGAGRSPHPPGWVSVVGGPNQHGPAARREIVACAGCHDKGPASNCVRCHRVGGVGGNPHPPGWGKKHRQRKEQDRVCRVCHG